MRTKLVPFLSADERARLARFQRQEDQERFLLGRGLLHLLAGAHLDLAAEDVELGCGPFGKPCIDARAGARAPHFNISHSGNLVLLAFHPVLEVGVDVEEVRPNPELAAIAARWFGPDVCRAWSQLDSVEQLTAFYQEWTRHEARLKALGTGFAEERPMTLPDRLTTFELSLPEGYQGAAACVLLAASARSAINSVHEKHLT